VGTGQQPNPKPSETLGNANQPACLPACPLKGRACVHLIYVFCYPFSSTEEQCQQCQCCLQVERVKDSICLSGVGGAVVAAAVPND
jgi:hypothetical protein